MSSMSARSSPSTSFTSKRVVPGGALDPSGGSLFQREARSALSSDLPHSNTDHLLVKRPPFGANEALTGLPRERSVSTVSNTCDEAFEQSRRKESLINARKTVSEIDALLGLERDPHVSRVLTDATTTPPDTFGIDPAKNETAQKDGYRRLSPSSLATGFHADSYVAGELSPNANTAMGVPGMRLESRVDSIGRDLPPWASQRSSTLLAAVPETTAGGFGSVLKTLETSSKDSVKVLSPGGRGVGSPDNTKTHQGAVQEAVQTRIVDGASRNAAHPFLPAAGVQYNEANNFFDSGALNDLTSQLEVALNAQLSFKHKFRSVSICYRNEAAGQDEDECAAAIPEAAAVQLNAPVPAAEAAPAVVAVEKPAGHGAGPKKPPGLAVPKLRVGKQLDFGEWASNGAWQPRVKCEAEPPENMQVIDPEDLTKVKELGRGSFGSVWLSKWRGIEVALKEMHNVPMDTPPKEVFMEAEKLASLRHPCVIAVYGIVMSKESYATVIEFMTGGSLSSGLRKLKPHHAGKRVRALIAMKAARGMEYLHSQFIVHFDLKCDNLLCDLRDLSNPVVKIGDMGLSKKKKDTFISGNMRGTLPWMAPELFPSNQGNGPRPGAADDRVNEKVDVFSFGVVMWEIWTLGALPYPGKNLQEIFMGIMSGNMRPDVPADCDPDWAALMVQCWHSNPQQRPPFSYIAAQLDTFVQTWTN